MLKFYVMKNVFPILGGWLFVYFGLGGLFEPTISRSIDLIIGVIGLLLMILAIYSAYKIDKSN